jgi:hypothetical protein
MTRRNKEGIRNVDLSCREIKVSVSGYKGLSSKEGSKFGDEWGTIV